MASQKDTLDELTSELLYTVECGEHRLLSAKEEYELIERAQAGDVDGRDELIACNQRLVMKIARRYHSRADFFGDLEFMDLVQYGNLGLLEAIRRFDLKRGARFAAYAGWWIRERIRAGGFVAGTSLSRTKREGELIIRIKLAESRLWMRLRRRPTPEEIAPWAKVSPVLVREILKLSEQHCLHIDGMVDSCGRPKEIVDSKPGVEEVVEAGDEVEKLRVSVARLRPPQRKVVAECYGLDGEEPKTQGEIAVEMGCSRSNVSRLLGLALETLRADRSLNGEPRSGHFIGG